MITPAAALDPSRQAEREGKRGLCFWGIGMYVKLFGSILDSSVWDESAETRLVWITMLLMADENGFVRGTHQSVARRAVVTAQQSADAIKVLESPDPRSHTTDHEGRRLQPLDGGWLVLNYGKYREYRTRKQVKEAEKKARQRERVKVEGTSPACPDVSTPYASALASDSVVSSTAAQKLSADAVECYTGFKHSPAMDKVLASEAEARSWGEVSQCVVEMSAAGAKWTPYVFRAFLAKIPKPPTAPLAVKGVPAPRPWCEHCAGPDMREGPTGRLTQYHVEGCPNA